MKRYILGFSLLGLVGCFLPLIGGLRVTVFNLHTVGSWLMVLAFAVPAIVAYRKGTAATVLAGLACYGYLGLRANTRVLDLILYAGIGGKLIGVAIIGGLIATLGVLLERRAATR